MILYFYVEINRTDVTVDSAIPWTRDYLINCSTEITFDKIMFSLPNSINSHTHFISSTSSLEIINCGIKMTSGISYIDYGILIVTAGSLTINSFKSNDLRFVNSILKC